MVSNTYSGEDPRGDLEGARSPVYSTWEAAMNGAPMLDLHAAWRFVREGIAKVRHIRRATIEQAAARSIVGASSHFEHERDAASYERECAVIQDPVLCRWYDAKLCELLDARQEGSQQMRLLQEDEPYRVSMAFYGDQIAGLDREIRAAYARGAHRSVIDHLAIRDLHLRDARAEAQRRARAAYGIYNGLSIMGEIATQYALDHSNEAQDGSVPHEEALLA